MVAGCDVRVWAIAPGGGMGVSRRRVYVGNERKGGRSQQHCHMRYER